MFAKNKKKKSILVLTLLFFWAAYIAIMTGQYYYNIAKVADQRIEDRKNTLNYVLEFSAGLLIQENLDHLKARLDQARELNLVDFYILQKRDRVVMFYNAQNNVEDINMDYKNFNVILETPEIAFKTIKIFDYRLTLGIVTDKVQLALTMANQQKYMILHDFTMVSLFLALILYMLLKDIINLSKVVTTRERGGVQNIQSLSKEGQALLSATSAYEINQQSLLQETEFLAESLTPAILHEIRNGTPSATRFDSTMVRIDLNGYTQLYLEKKEDYVTGILNRYFTAARELIERYGGLVYQYVGDEVVFHFKGPAEKSEPMAAACVRSLFELAEEIEKSLPIEAGHYFKLKASMASGAILFVKLDSGFGLSGVPLIESARLLSQVDDKTQNSMAVYESSRPYIESLCYLSDAKEGILKGFVGTSLVCQVKTFKSLQDVSATMDASFASYFRSDGDLAELLSYLQNLVFKNQDAEFFATVAAVSDLKTHHISSRLDLASQQFLEACAQVAMMGETVNVKVVSSLVSFMTSIIPAGKASAELVRALRLFLRHSSPRVQANTLLALSEAAPEVADLHVFMSSRHNRLVADALFVAGKKGLDKDLVRRIKALIDSPDKAHQLSGHYVVNRLLKHYESVDKVYFNSNPLIRELQGLSTQKAA